MGLFAICVSGWEEYRPIWFSGSCSVDNFKYYAKKAIDKIVRELDTDKDWGYIDGNSIMDKLVPVMGSFGFARVVPEIEIDIKGECLYQEREVEGEDRKPEIFDDETWKIIIEHNEKVHKNLYDEPERPNEYHLLW
jgi:hypothetical protein